MSSSATVDRCKDPKIAYGIEKRRQTMRDVITIISTKCALKIENAPHIARTYGLTTIEVEAEMMKHLSESDGK